MSDPTIELSVSSEGAPQDELVAVLSGVGFEGFWEDGPTLRAYVSSRLWDDAAMQTAQESLLAYAAAKGIPRPRVEVRTLLPQNWNAEWERSIQPVRISPGIIVTPSWHPLPQRPGELVLTIDPKMSFGTGHHETTRLVLSMMEWRVPKGGTVLDVGTGTGILAIAGVRLGARIAVGVDIDEWSFENARENAAVNGVEDAVKLYRGTLHDVPSGTFDLVTANIQRNVIEALLPDLTRRTAPEGWLFLSGLLAEERPAILDSFTEAGLRVEEERTADEWIGFALRHGQ
jgi:ribosomal protein L11 methyltransferase